jgi:hypothetical protein
MNREAKKWLARVAFVALVAIGTLMAGPRIAAARDCPFPTAGTCPPLADDGSCDQACQSLGYEFGGQCHVGCCVCFE